MNLMELDEGEMGNIVDNTSKGNAWSRFTNNHHSQKQVCFLLMMP